MVKFYTGSGGAPSAPSAPKYTGYTGSSSQAAPTGGDTPGEGAGKFNLGLPDFSSPGTAIGGIAKGAGDLVGGVAGAIGSIGIPGGPNLGGVGQVAGVPLAAGAGVVDEVLKAVGSIGLPDLGPLVGRNNNAQATLGDILPKMVEVVGAPLHALERTVAGQRVENRLGLSAADLKDLQDGKSVDEVADRMVDRGAGFIDNPWLNLGSQLIFDPVNWISLGAGGAIHEAASAGAKAAAITAGEGVGERVGNQLFSVLANGAPERAMAEADDLAASVAEGAFHSVGHQPFNDIIGASSKLDPAYGDALHRAFSVGAAQYGPAVMARRMGLEYENASRGVAQAGAEDLRRAYGDALITDAKSLRKDVENMADARAPIFIDMTDAERFTEASKMVARASGMPEDMATQLVRDTFGEAPSIEQMRTLDLMDYGAAAAGLDDARAAFTGPEMRAFQQANDLTLMARDTLSHSDASELRDLLNPGQEVIRRREPYLNRVAKEVARIDQKRNAAKVAEDAIKRFDRFADLRGTEKARGAAAVKAVRERVGAYLDANVLPQGIEAKATTAAADELAAPAFKVLEGPELDAYIAADKAVAKAEREYHIKFPDKDVEKAKDVAAKAVKKLRAEREKAASAIKREALPADAAAPAAAKAKRATNLPKSLQDFIKSQADGGYRVGFVPEGDAMVRRLEDGSDLFIRPFARSGSDVQLIKPANAVGRIMDGAGRQITTAKIINAARVRMAKTARGVKMEVPMSEHESTGFFRAVLKHAQERGVAPRGLDTRGINEYDNIAETVWGKARYNEFKAAGGDATGLVMHAFAGNWKEVGITQKLSGELKAAFPKTLPFITDNLYPFWRFGKASPGFQWQEVIESPFLGGMRGIRPVRGAGAQEAVFKQAQEMYKDFIERTELTSVSGRVAGDAAGGAAGGRLFDDAGGILQIAGEESAARGFGPGSKLGRAMSHVAPKNVVRGKDANMMAQMVSEHPEMFKEALEQSFGPRYWKVMEETYGTKDIAAITKSFMEERMAFAKGGEDWAKVIDAGKSAFMADAVEAGKGFTSADMETVWQAYRTSAVRAADVARRTHYFQSGRSFLERSINHPFLGIYPASYMAKVAREYARFLLARPFGLKAPLAGYAAVAHVQRAIVIQMQTDPKFKSFMEDNKDVLYLLNLMLPGLPDNLPANAPAVLRHVAEDQLAGKPFSPTKAIADMPTDAFGHMGIGRDVGAVSSAAQQAIPDIFGTLDTATKMVQGIFGPDHPNAQP